MNTSSQEPDEAARPPSRTGRGMRRLAFGAIVLVILGAAAVSVMVGRHADDLGRAQGALELQVLTSRLGAAAIQAEHGQYGEAQELVSGVFDGIVNYGIEQGSLPENYARVLRTRDEVVVALAQARPEVTERLVELFFTLQLPIDTELDSRYIIPATDSGLGMSPPLRRMDQAPVVQPADPGPGAAPVTSPDTSGTGGC